MYYFQGGGTENVLSPWAGFEPGEMSEGGWRDPHHPQLGSLPAGPSPQMTWAPNEAGGRWAADELSDQHWAVPWQYQQQNNPPLTEHLLWDCAMGTADTSWKSGGQSVSQTLPGFIEETLEPSRSYISEPQPGGISEEGAPFDVGSSIGGFPAVDIESLRFHGGVGFVSKAESLEESHFFEAPGGEDKGMNFQGYESQEVCVSQQSLAGWLQSEPTRRDSVLDNQVLTEAVFLGREKSGSEREENLKQGSDLPSRQPVKSKKHEYLCTECGETFAYKSTCVECNERFPQPADLIHHERTDAGEKPHVCSVCGKAYVARSNFLLHRNTHIGKKPYSCLECGKSFSWNSELATHSIKHRREESFRCLECGRSFSRRSNLKVHMKKIHSKEPQISTDCEES